MECDRTEETAETLYTVALSFLQLQANTNDCELTAQQLRTLPDVTNMLASEALAVCSCQSGPYGLVTLEYSLKEKYWIYLTHPAVSFYDFSLSIIKIVNDCQF